MKYFFNFRVIVFTFLLLPFLNGCNDEDAKSPEQLRAEEIELLAGTEGKEWVLLTATSGGFELSQLIPNCDRDNIYFLSPGGEGEYRSGATTCEENEPDVLETGMWDLSDDLGNLTLTIGIISSDSKILNLTKDRLQLEFTTQDGQVVVATFKPAD